MEGCLTLFSPLPPVQTTCKRNTVLTSSSTKNTKNPIIALALRALRVLRGENSRLLQEKTMARGNSGEFWPVAAFMPGCCGLCRKLLS